MTSIARTLFDLAEAVDEDRLRRAFEEADRLRLLEFDALENLCEFGHGRRALRPIGRLLSEAQAPEMTRSPLEDRFIELCRDKRLPRPSVNVLVRGLEVDAVWPAERLIAELDGFAFHGHHAAFERDRRRDAVLQSAGYRVIRLTHRRLTGEPDTVAAELRALLNAAQLGAAGLRPATLPTVAKRTLK